MNMMMMMNMMMTNMKKMTTDLKVGRSARKGSEQAEAARWAWHQHDFRAMNTHIHICVYSCNHASITEALNTFAHYENHLSRFDPQSELAQLNHSKCTTNRVSNTLFQAVEMALYAAQATGGLYDPTILNALQLAGYDRSFERMTLDMADDIASATSSDLHHSHGVTFRDIDLNPRTLEIRKPPGFGLDLGGMGKGWTVDRVADQLAAEGPFLINAGGDLYGYGSPQSTRGWEIDLEHPLDSNRILARFNIKNNALATSSIAKRQWRKERKTMHHVIDPRSGKPAHSDVLSVSVVASRTVLAEIYAKTALILGSRSGLAYLQSLPDVAGALFTNEEQLLLTSNATEFLN